MRDLNAQIAAWRSRMAAEGLKSPAVLDELESHLREEIDRQTRSGADQSDAFEMAAKKIGGSELLKSEFAKIERFREIPVGRVVGAACCAAAALYSMVLAPALVTVRELDLGQRFLGLSSLFLTLLCFASLRFGHRYLPVIRNRGARIISVSACAAAGFFWLFIFSNLLPNVIVPQLMARTEHEGPAEHTIYGGFEPRTASLQVHNQLSPTYRIAQPGFTAPSEAMTAVFNIGLSLFWAMTLGAGLGSLAYGLEEAAKRRSMEEHAYV
jgi:hypothetical protein